MAEKNKPETSKKGEPEIKEGKEMKEKVKTEQNKPEQGKPESQKKAAPETKDGKELREKVRVYGIVLDGNKDVRRSIMKIKGIGYRTSKVIAKTLDTNAKLGSLTDKQIEDLEGIIKNFGEKVPFWMVNHQKEMVSGKDIHVTGTDLDQAVKADIDHMKKMRCYKGVRHILGQPVRGQRTKTSFRTGRTLGVVKKKQMPATAAKKDTKGK